MRIHVFMALTNPIVNHICERCGYSTTKIAHFKQHESSKRHLHLLQTNQMYQKPEKTHECATCNNKYSSYSALYRHRTTVHAANQLVENAAAAAAAVMTTTITTINNNNNNNINSKIINNTSIVNNNILNQIVINKYVNPIIVNNNMTTLNEKCNKAKNLDDFLKSIIASPEFYQKFGDRDYKKCEHAFYTLLENHLNELPITQRPLHSSKQPNEIDQVMYVRSDDKWIEELEPNWGMAFSRTDYDTDNAENTNRWNSILNNCFTEFTTKMTDDFEVRRITDCKKLIEKDKISRNLVGRLGPDAMLRVISLITELVNIEKSKELLVVYKPIDSL